MTCPRCGYALEPFDAACPRCASQTQMSAIQTGTLPDGQMYKICPHCRQPATMQIPRCGRCGYAYGTGAIGSQAVNSLPPQYPAPTRYAPQGYSTSTEPGSERRRFAWIAGGILGVVALLVFVVPVFAPRPSHNTTSKGTGGGNGMLLLQSAANSQGKGGLLNSADSQQIDHRLLSSGAKTGGEVEVSLAWNSLTDLDLSVQDPSGEIISGHERRSSSGGVLDVDANPTPITPEGVRRAASGRSPGPENVLPVSDLLVDLTEHLPSLSGYPEANEKAPAKYTHTPVEHIYFAHAPKGIYTVYAHCYYWREKDATPLPFTIEVRSHGKVFHHVTSTIGSMSFVSDEVTPTMICQFQVQ